MAASDAFSIQWVKVGLKPCCNPCLPTQKLAGGFSCRYLPSGRINNVLQSKLPSNLSPLQTKHFGCESCHAINNGIE
jgi:hypothetical protein